MTFSNFSSLQLITSLITKVRSVLYINHLIFILKVVRELSSFGKSKSMLPEVKSAKIETWPKPNPKAFSPEKKLMWGFWNSGEENMPPFVKLCVESWRVKNPDFTVTILSDDNFHQYVATHEIPSTF